MSKCIKAAFLVAFASSAFAQDVMPAPQEGSDDFALSQDSMKTPVALLPVPQSYRFESDVPVIQTSSQPEAVNHSTLGQSQAKTEVLLIPTGEIKTSYSGKADNDVIFLLKRAINLTQLQYKSEAEYTPVSSQLTVDRVQVFLAQAAQAKLGACGIASELPNEDAKGEAVQGKPADYIYQVDLGITRLMISKSLFGTSLTGEAEARVVENSQPVKKIQVDSFGGGKVTLEKFGEGTESDAELKSATSKVVEFLANKLGDKLCKYFN